VVKLFTNVEEDQPLPMRYWIVAITCTAVISAAILYFLW
jgi:hypothetical protein